MSESIFDSQNAGYVQLLYEDYARNPESVPEEWRSFFAQGAEVTMEAGLIVPEGLGTNGRPDTLGAESPGGPAALALPGGDEGVERLLPVVARATSFVQAYRDHGHMLARIDALGTDPPGHPQLDPSFFGTSLDELKQIPARIVMGPAARDENLADTLQRLREAYCGWIGYEFEHLEDPSRVRWLWEQVESGVHTTPMEDGRRVQLLQRLSEVEGFEQFLHRAFLGQKRFSIEGTDMLVPILDLALEEAAAAGGRKVVMGMAHRGRLNVLAHIIGIGYSDIIREYEGVHHEGALTVPGTGDVKYHHGAEGDYSLRDGSSIRVVLAPNPSHLEFVDPVVLGMTRAMQFGTGGRHTVQDTSAVVPILIHGDAAFAAEGVVAETLNLARLPAYSVGGTIHVIVNNKIGFTTGPSEGRSTRYASDLAKGFDLPILHVNADRPEACMATLRLAMAYRAEFGDDIVIDLVGYRRHGHNEGDEPAYTQPTLYRTIEAHPTVRALWASQLLQEGVVAEVDVERFNDQVAGHLHAVLEGVQQEEGRASGPKPPPVPQEAVSDTAVPFEDLASLTRQALSWPDGFTVHPKLARQFDRRREDFGPDAAIDWAHAETLALGSLLAEGFLIRLTGQDSQRGTFSQRHLVLHDFETGRIHIPLTQVGEGRLEVYNSPLSEAAVLGYEYGYSVAAQKDLVLWEAQFGDFVNAAQVAVDQFIASGREKWNQYANLTLLLPHGYEGQGPEHSSAKLERFLQICAEDNMSVTYPTTPAQYFHLLRRQAHTRPERPLVTMTPKSLLRLPAAASRVSELSDGRFQRVIDDPAALGRRDEIRRLVLCTGKVYYELQGGDRRDTSNAAIGRVEELYPFPGKELEALVGGYPNLEEVVWAQEEPRNMGALTFVGPLLRGAVPRHIPLRWVARPERASPAEGKVRHHRSEQERIVREALGIGQD